MQIKEVSFEFGMTQNLGDYTNVRPSVKLVAEITEDDDLAQVLAQLENTVRTAVHDIVDDELEAAGRTVKYYRGPLCQVYYSDIRRCIVIVRSGIKPPQEKNWKHSDHWSGYIHSGNFPTHMRPHTARRAASAEQQTSGWPMFDCTDDDFSILPPLPDAGPEPVWYQKRLRPHLNNARIDEAHWEELAVLEHVTEEYLEKVYREKVGYGRNSLHGEELLAFIRENRPFEVEPEPEEDDYDDDYDEDDDDEF